ncbi:hypothetical protein [Entomohabitans teleogrylli]|uniref:hypothetical protein n=1 Tax=Entomohabitans teleogrylli TaxID=1384589 RepID=UPI0012B6907D|nr:hypothetical protein [Entomohabitans teleogrylli]
MTSYGDEVNITMHISQLTKRLALFNSVQRIKFGIWCLWPMINDFEIKKFLDKINGDGTCSHLAEELKAIWSGNFSPERLHLLCTYLEDIDWDQDEIDEDDESASQGAMDFLGGMSSLVHGYLDDSIEYIANCAELIINRISYLIDFGRLDDSALGAELKKQMVTLSLINKKEDFSLSLENRL